MLKRTGLPRTKKIKPELPAGFRDYAPADAIARQKMLETIRKTFEDFGFDPLETPAVERTETLTGGEADSQKIIFNVRGSKEKKSDSSLRFDLTVPLARFFSANPDIPKPFKRYQIGNVWRGESPQAGRYREFMQADIDTVGAFSPEADAEIIAVIYASLKNLGISRFAIKINSRKILNGLPRAAGFQEKKLWDALRIIDKRDKIGEAGVAGELEKVFGKKVPQKITAFLLNPKVALSGSGDEADKGLSELLEIRSIAGSLGVEKDKIEIDYAMARGLGYYTGPIFEAVLLDAPELGSMFSGGRYDNLIAAFTGQKIPAVGASLGMDRLFSALDKLGSLKKRATTAKVLILNLSPSFRDEYFKFAKTLRDANINTALYLGDDRAFQAQLAYALKKEIPYAVIYGENENQRGVVTIKNLATREQGEIPKGNILQYFKKF